MGGGESGRGRAAGSVTGLTCVEALAQSDRHPKGWKLAWTMKQGRCYRAEERGGEVSFSVSEFRLVRGPNGFTTGYWEQVWEAPYRPDDLGRGRDWHPTPADGKTWAELEEGG